MKSSSLALLLVGISTAAVAVDFHPGAYPTLQLESISQKDLTVKLKGYVILTGKIEAVWENGPDGAPAYQSFSLVPDADAAAKMPSLDDYRVNGIDILNGSEALRLVAGPAVAAAFEQKQTLRVTAVGTFRLTRVGLGIACDRLHAGAYVQSVTGISQLALEKRSAPMSFC